MQIPVLGVYSTSFLSFLEFVYWIFVIFSAKEYKFPGDHIPGVPPVPIPNTAVKPRVANGRRTLGPARVGRCQVYGPVFRKKNWAFLFERDHSGLCVRRFSGLLFLAPPDD